MNRIYLLFFFFSVYVSSWATEKFNLYIATNYIAESTIIEFEQRCQCELSINYFGDPQEMEAKIAAGATGYDLIVGTGYAIEDLYHMGKLISLQLNKIYNLKNIPQAMLAAPYDLHNNYSLPYAYTVTLIGYNVNKLQQLKINPNTWGVIFDERNLKKLKGHITVFDSARNVFGAALLYLGFDPNTTKIKEILQAKMLIEQAAKYWTKYDSVNYYRALLSQEAWVSMSYSSDLYNTIRDAKKAKLAYSLNGMLQKEGNLLEIDNTVIPKASDKKDLAYLFINTELEGRNAAALANATGSTIANSAAMPYVESSLKSINWIFPLPKTKLYSFSAYDPKTRLLVNEMWTEIKMECH